VTARASLGEQVPVAVSAELSVVLGGELFVGQRFVAVGALEAVGMHRIVAVLQTSLVDHLRTIAAEYLQSHRVERAKAADQTVLRRIVLLLVLLQPWFLFLGGLWFCDFKTTYNSTTVPLRLHLRSLLAIEH